MKSVYYTGLENFEVKEHDIPVPGDDWVLLRNKFCGVCGTDVHIFHGEPGSADVNPPVVLGHEFSGEVIKVGKNVTSVAVGDHVTVDPNIYCGECVYCRNGKKQLCPSMEAVGVTMDGGFAQYSVVPASQLFVLDKSVPFEFGAMAEPVACCLHGIDISNIQPGSNVCIVGGGAIGLIMLQLASLAGAAKLVLSEPNEMRRKVAEQLCNVLTVNPQEAGTKEKICEYFGTDGADVVIECAGNNYAVANCFDFAGKGATVTLFSVPRVDAEYSIKLFDIYKKELTIKGSFVNPDTHDRAVRIINSGKIDLKPIITHTFDLDHLTEAIEEQSGSKSIKVIVDCK